MAAISKLNIGLIKARGCLSILTITIHEVDNPFRLYVMPLAREHYGVMQAVLGLAACHLSVSDSVTYRVDVAMEYRGSALNALSSCLAKAERCGLTTTEEDAILAMILLLVLHDICESGMSTEAYHLTGVSHFCGRVAAASESSRRTDASMFFLSALAWLDVLRGFSGAEKLTYSEEVRRCVASNTSLQTGLHTLIGCPPIIFQHISNVIAVAKSHMEGQKSLTAFEEVLADTQHWLRKLDLDKLNYPTADPNWKHLAEAYRHACLLRVMRWPHTFSIPCHADEIKQSVSAIFDACALVPMDSSFYKRLLFPLFMAAADTSVGHQMHYADLCIEKIKNSTGFRHAAMDTVLRNVREERRRNTKGWPNVPWMEFVSIYSDICGS
ncbi:hypothetical protein C8035_v006267 [Colletotrichum spinosum]|uniref:Uncharacterized protein n=1 Tax=Colletotrichum spinosum TaxID=1347390 RepID=A0A4R8QWJ1_9PEZI|nr:hypothetical protein C8035_v006267 [Colletotrichum spinosum]